jgi:steroid delta-isomerase-like uncharacterized protein
MSDQNKAAARTFFDIFNSGDVDRLDEIMSPSWVDHDPQNPFAEEGLEGTKKVISMYREAFPDLRVMVEDQVAEGDRVVTRWTATGTHQGELMGITPTGRNSTVTGLSMDRFEGGKIVEGWNNWDTLGMLQQLGVARELAGARA